MQLLENFKKNLIGNIIALATAVLIIFALAFYSSAIRNNFSAWQIVIGVVAILLLLAGTVIDMKGIDDIVATALTAFLFGFFLIGRLESINFIQVHLSDINVWFYVDIVFFIAALVCALAMTVVKTIFAKKA